MQQALDVAGQILRKRKRRHFVKTAAQEAELELEWQRDHRFDTERIRQLSERIGLDRRVIYKWQWDHNNGHHARIAIAKQLMAAKKTQNK